MKILRILLFLVLIIFSINVTGQKINAFENGSTICFLGNSITHGGYYHHYINLFYRTRYPEMKLHFVNCGISGDTSPKAIARLEKDVLPHDPDIVVIMFGMNDVNRSLYSHNPGYEDIKLQLNYLNAFKTNLDSLTTILMNQNISIIYLTPTIYDQTVINQTPNNFGVNDALGRCKNIIFNLAEYHNIPVINLYDFLNDYNKIRQKENPNFSIIGNDRIHPGKEGHLLMAWKFIISQKVKRFVSEIKIDAKMGTILCTENSTVHSLQKNEKGISFMAKSFSLPFPVNNNFAFRWIPAIDSINAEIIQITNLQSGRYILKIDSETIGEFDDSELSAGINLSSCYNTPQYQQSEMVDKLILMRANLERERIRSLRFFEFGWFENFPNNASTDSLSHFFTKELQKIDQESYYPFIKELTKNYLLYKNLENNSIEELKRLDDNIYHVSQPFYHKYEIIRN
jgi:lysophospholipase L1-like esterase